MEIRARTDQNWFVISVVGRLDAMTTSEFEKQCVGWIAEGQRRMLLDFSSLDYISSAGLRGILATAKKLKGTGGVLAVCSLSGVVKEVFTISAFDSIIPTYDNLASAQESKG